MVREILLTGGAGFIGSAVARSLLARGDRVVVVDNLSTGYRECVPEGCEFVEGGCEDPATWARVPQRQYHAIYHIAGQSSGEISFENPVYDLQTNTQSSLLLLDLARRLGCDRLIYAGTMSVYGDQPDQAVREDAVCRPNSFYAVGKLASEHYLRIHEQFGVRSTVLRLFNVYGPGQNLANLKQGMVSIYLALALRDRKVTVKGSLDRFRDFVFIDDVVSAFLAAEAAPSACAQVLNVCTGVKTTVGGILDSLERHVPHPFEVQVRGGTPGDQFGIYGSHARMTELTGWQPTTKFDEGLRRMTEWARSQLV